MKGEKEINERISELIEKMVSETKDEEWMKETCEKAIKILEYFRRKWIHWETIGWALARLLGFTEEDIDEVPELGWIVKAVVGYVLSQSEKQKERLVGKALLRLCEIPPYSIMVEFGGEENYIPAIAAHYRISWNFPEIRSEYEKVIRSLEGK